MRLETLETRQLLAANSIGVTPLDTGEFLLGTVAVTPVFFDSNGLEDTKTQNWAEGEIDQVMAKLTEGVNWWSDTLDTLGTVHSLDFVFDDTYAEAPVPTKYEPIDRTSTEFELYVTEFLQARGLGDASSIEAGVREFNQSQRLALGTDWAFTIFVVDSSDDGDGFFPVVEGSFPGAFAFAGGLFYVVPSGRPASTFAHEMGHIFWALDEYNGGAPWTETRGYYDTQNLNAENNPSPGHQSAPSIMLGGTLLDDAYVANTSPATTLAMVGWQDSDNDGVFDLADVPLSFDAVGYFDSSSSTYHLSGVASAAPLINRNSEGTQSDITLNRISALQYSIDSGLWLTAAEPDAQIVEFDVEITIDQPFTTIQWRVIDQSTGILSPTVDGTPAIPAMPQASVSAIAFVDQDGGGERSIDESLLSLTEISIRNADGSELFGGSVDAADFGNFSRLRNLEGVEVTADGLLSQDSVYSVRSTQAGNQRVFHALGLFGNDYSERWSAGDLAFEASFDEPVGKVQIDAIGLGEMSFGRLEAYDASGTILTRTTSEGISNASTVTLEVTDPQGRIASIRAFGHADTSVALNNLLFGFEPTAVSDNSGALRLNYLPDGNYLVDLTPANLIHQFSQSSHAVEVVAGTSPLIVAAAQRVNSPRHNETLPEDANNLDGITSLDALVIINDLNRFGARTLQPSETTGFDVDVSNDGVVSALDALLVINFLGRQGSGGAGEGSFESTLTTPPIATSARLSLTQEAASGVATGASVETMDADTSGGGASVTRGPAARKSGEFTGLLTVEEADSTPQKAEKQSEIDKSIRSEIPEPFGQSPI